MYVKTEELSCYFVVASLNLDLSRGQILNDAKSIKNSKRGKPSTFFRAQIVAKKFALFSVPFQSKLLTRSYVACENWDFNFRQTLYTKHFLRLYKTYLFIHKKADSADSEVVYD